MSASAVASFFSSFLPTVYAEEAQEKPEEKESSNDKGKEEKEDGEAAPEAEEEEEPEPEDLAPAIREDCANSAQCGSFNKHFQHCEEKIRSGKGYKHEDCVEELLMHCVDNCAAPKVFSKLK